MNLKEFSNLDNVTSYFKINNKDIFEKEINCISIVMFPGDLFFVHKNSFVFIIADCLSAEVLSKVLAALILKNISGCCIVHNADSIPIEEIIISSYSSNSLPLFCIKTEGDKENFFNGILSSIIGVQNVYNFLEEQLKNNILCIMNTEYFNIRNLTCITGLFLMHETFLLSSQFNLLCQSTIPNDKNLHNLPLNKWSKELSGFDSSKSPEPVIFDNNGCDYYCFCLKTSGNIAGYLCIKKYNELWGNLDTAYVSEIIPYFMLCMTAAYNNNLHQKSIDEYLQYVLFGLYTDENALKAETRYYNFEYYLKRFVWLLQIEPLNKTEDSIPDAVISKIKYLAKQIYYKNTFITQKSQIISIQLKNNTKNNDEHIKMYQMLIDNLESEYPQYRFYIGVSRAYENIYQLKYAYEDAKFGLMIGKTLFSNTSKKIFCYDDLLIYHLLYDQINNPILGRLYNNTIKKIKLYDNKKDGQLYKTLYELIEFNFNLNKAAENLYIHRNTLYQRIKKIEEIIDLPMHNLETQLLLQLGLKLDYIQNQTNKLEDKD